MGLLPIPRTPFRCSQMRNGFLERFERRAGSQARDQKCAPRSDPVSSVNLVQQHGFNPTVIRTGPMNQVNRMLRRVGVHQGEFDVCRHQA